LCVKINNLPGEAEVSFWRIVEILMGFGCIALGIFNREFKPIGWTTWLVWGTGDDARIPRWIAGPFYVLLGVFALYMGFSGK
jgi:hypothetical protein